VKATRFMRKPFFVKGHKVTEENMHSLAKWCQGTVVTDGNDKPLFVRVPVDNPTKRWQTEAYPGTWIVVSVIRNRMGLHRSFKVYLEEWLLQQFFEVEEDLLGSDGDDDISTQGSGEAPSTTATEPASNVRNFPVPGPGPRNNMTASFKTAN